MKKYREKSKFFFLSYIYIIEINNQYEQKKRNGKTTAKNNIG